MVFNRAVSSPEVRAVVNTEGPGISDGKRSDIQEGFGFMALLKLNLLPILTVFLVNRHSNDISMCTAEELAVRKPNAFFLTGYNLVQYCTPAPTFISHATKIVCPPVAH